MPACRQAGKIIIKNHWTYVQWFLVEETHKPDSVFTIAKLLELTVISLCLQTFVLPNAWL
jgi:hypothetical protein